MKFISQKIVLLLAAFVVAISCDSKNEEVINDISTVIDKSEKLQKSMDSLQVIQDSRKKDNRNFQYNPYDSIENSNVLKSKVDAVE